ncbi:TetR/AcrR family transcriptional regulator [Nannocystis bainbridge]|uniref:TetR family transcriptional regulator n=1 Tax=Nannocystis bainbridge TaxID=2995303 RepID=A0ABT5E9I8_9BACT|nr:TetR/AcrR family transcriptional regulator [Nannocystis bainbridge]MDC0722527.1 TetR family transcriptional regulator [Nannocystis bainbridge]
MLEVNSRLQKTPMAQRKSPSRPRSAAAPRPRDAEQTRAEILHAARVLFATRGYANAGMREIAAAAGITPALVVRYFGSKRDLFVAAIESDIALGPFLGPDRATVGRHIARHFFSKPVREVDTLSILLHAAGQPEVCDLATELLATRVIQPLARWLGPPRAEARASLVLAIISGTWLFRQALPMRAFAGGPDTSLASCLAAQIQHVVDGLPEP